jgi:hypothetical protein
MVIRLSARGTAGVHLQVDPGRLEEQNRRAKVDPQRDDLGVAAS